MSVSSLARASALLALVVASAPLSAQSVTGRVVDAVTQETLPSATVAVLGPGDALVTGAATDADGAFTVSGLDAGTYRVRASFVGYDARLLADVVVQGSRPTFLLFELRPSAVVGDEVVVTGGLFEDAPDAPVSVATLGPEEIRRTPGGQNDISRSLLALPGVTGAVDNRNDLLVRGGGPSENAYFVDGIEIPQINHFATQGAAGGALGLLNVDFIREATFYTGGFPVRYGDAASSVLVVENRPGSPGVLSGDVTVGASEAGVSLDGSSGPDFNWTFSARRSYLQLLFELIDLPIRPAYWDFQSRVEYTPTDDDRLVYFGLWAVDDFDIAQPDDPDDFEGIETASRVLDNDQRSYTQGVSWRRLFPNGVVTTAVSRSYQEFFFDDLDEAGAPLLSNDAEEAAWRLRSDADFRVSPTLTLGVGGGASRETVASEFFQRATPGTPFDQDLRFDTDLGLWKGFGYAQLTARAVGGRLAVTAGVRADATDFLDQAAVASPRLSASFDVTDAVEVSAAVGRFTQSPELVSLAVQQDGAYVNRSLDWIDVGQLVGGVAVTPTASVRLSAEGYYKSYGSYPVSASDPRVSLANQGGDFGTVGAEPLVSVGGGRAYGVEVSAQKRLTSRFYGLGSYTLGWSEFSGADGVFRPSAWDVRHNVSLTGGVRLGGWEVGTRLAVLSGRPFTPFDLAASREEYALSRRGVRDLDRLNAERTGAYARLDLRVDRRFALGRRVNGVVYVDVQNVLDRENVFSVQYTEDPAEPDFLRDQTNVGRLPTVGFSVEF
ncbi:TonB-dependent receptor [Rubrivirga litoralis]|uniref:TonB-dependent receptor n=1 Tax=Rubrivirga litoralis TaxID=3075598 RepID=A0ABU3BRM0_9BACT|nr:TonB-dependent receptor [Rubrivirga sp. F394]MDT0631936.1 TonB-dependent receptor [Rubrivirga sp. F394]